MIDIASPILSMAAFFYAIWSYDKQKRTLEMVQKYIQERRGGE